MYATRPSYPYNESIINSADTQNTKSNTSATEREKRLERFRNEESVYVRMAQGRRNNDDGIRWLG